MTGVLLIGGILVACFVAYNIGGENGASVCDPVSVSATRQAAPAI